MPSTQLGQPPKDCDSVLIKASHEFAAVVLPRRKLIKDLQPRLPENGEDIGSADVASPSTGCPSSRAMLNHALPALPQHPGDLRRIGLELRAIDVNKHVKRPYRIDRAGRHTR